MEWRRERRRLAVGECEGQSEDQWRGSCYQQTRCTSCVVPIGRGGGMVLTTGSCGLRAVITHAPVAQAQNVEQQCSNATLLPLG